MIKKTAMFIAIALGMSACTIQPYYKEAKEIPKASVPMVKVVPSSLHPRPPLNSVSQPPDVLRYRNINDDVVMLNAYATDLNWYLFYLFSYTHVINKYAIARGWTPPKTEPLCKTFKWPKQMDVPIFEYREGMSLEDIDVELTIYIEEAQARYEEQGKLFEEAEMWQRRLCMY